jgi:hypothetical protein
MTDAEFALGLKHLLEKGRVSELRVLADEAHFKRIAREQKIQLVIGRLKIDAACAALEARMTRRRARI